MLAFLAEHRRGLFPDSFTADLFTSARTPQFKQAYRTRAVERVIAWTATSHGQRVKLRYLGTSKNNAWLHTGPPPSTCAP